MSESLAVRHRPRRFADLVGQRHVTAVLRPTAAQRNPPQQILLFGGSGIGKTTVARILAAALNCEAPADDGDACGTCPTCQTIAAGNHPDIVELDAASHGGKDEIREIAERSAFAPMRSEWKMYIIDEAHGLTGPGAQAFLKLLEEPPAHVLFALATTDPDKLPRTLRGRCLQCELLVPAPAALADNLVRIASTEGWDLDVAVAAEVVAATDPTLGIRGTIMTLEKLAGPLGRSEKIDLSGLAELLGTADPAAVDAITARIMAEDRPGALLALEAARSRFGDDTLRRALSTWARAMLFDACVSGDPEGVALWRYQQLVTAASGAAWTDLTVATVAAPALRPEPALLEALCGRAEHAVAALAAHHDLTAHHDLAAHHDRDTRPAVPATTTTLEIAAPADVAPVPTVAAETAAVTTATESLSREPAVPVPETPESTTPRGAAHGASHAARQARPVADLADMTEPGIITGAGPVGIDASGMPGDVAVAWRNLTGELWASDTDAANVIHGCEVRYADGIVFVTVPAALLDSGKRHNVGTKVRLLAVASGLTVKFVTGA